MWAAEHTKIETDAWNQRAAKHITLNAALDDYRAYSKVQHRSHVGYIESALRVWEKYLGPSRTPLDFFFAGSAMLPRLSFSAPRPAAQPRVACPMLTLPRLSRRSSTAAVSRLGQHLALPTRPPSKARAEQPPCSRVSRAVERPMPHRAG